MLEDVLEDLLPSSLTYNTVDKVHRLTVTLSLLYDWLWLSVTQLPLPRYFHIRTCVHRSLT